MGLTLDSFESLPRRIFLDSSTLQTIHGYGEWIWEGIEPPPSDPIRLVPGGMQELHALRAIFLVNERAHFEFALSKRSFREVTAKGDSIYLRWACDVLDHWEACLQSYGAEPFDGLGLARASLLDDPSFGYLSSKDRQLIRDALALECDAFLTMERRLPRNAEHLRRRVQLRILRPSAYRSLLEPWARLYV